MSINSVMPSNSLILCCCFLLPSVFPSIRSFPMSQLFTSGSQSIGAPASVSTILTTSKSLSVSSNTVYSVPGNFRNHVSLLISFSTPSMAPSATTLLNFLQDPDPHVLASQHCVYSRLCHQQRALFRHHDASFPCIHLLLWRYNMACGSLVPRPETEPGPQPWKCRVLTAGPPGKSRSAQTLRHSLRGYLGFTLSYPLFALWSAASVLPSPLLWWPSHPNSAGHPIPAHPWITSRSCF